MELKLYPRVIVTMAQVVRIKPDYVEAYETVASASYPKKTGPGPHKC